jgi:hypothetical protein
VRVVQLLSWQQRLSSLAGRQQQLAAALLAAVRTCQAAMQGGGDARQQAAWPADGHGASLAEVQRQLLAILCAYVDQGLLRLQQQQRQQEQGQERGSDGAAANAAAGGPLEEAAAAAQRLADAAIRCCLLVRRPDALWSDVYPRFASASPQQPAAAGERAAEGEWGAGTPGEGQACGAPASPAAAFLLRLPPFILGDQLPGVAPEVMQALVGAAVGAGRGAQLEACVLRMDLLSLDLNQVGLIGAFSMEGEGRARWRGSWAEPPWGLG